MLLRTCLAETPFDEIRYMKEAFKKCYYSRCIKAIPSYHKKLQVFPQYWLRRYPLKLPLHMLKSLFTEASSLSRILDQARNRLILQINKS